MFFSKNEDGKNIIGFMKETKKPEAQKKHGSLKMKKTIFKISFVLICLSPGLCFPQEKIDYKIISRIKEAGFQHSQVMNTLIYLADVHGPRLSGTPDYRNAAEWSKTQMETWGLDNVRLERYESDFPGWTVESLSVQMIEPRFASIISQPAAWTGSTPGEITGVPVLFNFHNLDSLKLRKGELKGKILMLPESKPRQEPMPRVYDEQILKETGRQINLYGPKGLGGRRHFDLREAQREDFDTFGKTRQDSIMTLLIQAEVAAVLEPSYLDNGVIGVSEASFPYFREGKAIPYIFISKEDHGRLVRMMKREVEPVIKIHQKTRFYHEPDYHVNVIGDISGHDKKRKNEIVFIGGHLDSWHGGTGASDNAAGVAVMMEVMRIIKQLDIKPRRTVRIGLWGGEEQFFDGSLGYTRTHIADLLGTEEDKGELSRISIYINHDTGDGQIRGIFLMGNEALRPFASACLEPFHYLGVKTVTIQNSYGTDHMLFDALNIPTFEFIQDPSLYESHQWHTSMDVTDLVTEDNLKINAVVIATLVYHAAMRDEILPRKLN